MAFSLHNFVMTTLLGMVGSEPEYKVRQYALGWYDRAELTTEDMETLDAALTPPVVEPVDDGGEPTGEPEEEPTE